MKTVYQIREYGSFITGRKVDGYVTLPEHTFQQLENFILTNRGNNKSIDFMEVSVKKGVGRVLTAKNYVGIIALRDGTAIEILPKICQAVEKDCRQDSSRQILFEMLKSLRQVPYKSMQMAHINIEKMSVLEIFIRMFIDEVIFIIKRGLKHNYETVAENKVFVKGKLLFNQHIRKNFLHKERSYVEHDEFTSNCPENRLLKATLLQLSRYSFNSRNRKDIKILLEIFSAVPSAHDYNSDFSRCRMARNSKYYVNALSWCRIFLSGRSFTTFSGTDAAMALLFPMELLFESYVADKLRRRLAEMNFTIALQDRRYHLFDMPEKKFRLKPDIVITRKTDGAIFILDTKWKALDKDKANFGIFQQDMYQMFVYQKKYNAKHTILLYPKTEKVPVQKQIEFKSADGIIIKVKFIDLLDVSSGLTEIEKSFEQED